MKNFLTKTKGSFQRNPRINERRKHIFLIVVAFCVLYFLGNIVAGLSVGISNAVYSVKHYFETSSATIPVYLRSRTELLERIQSLEHEVSLTKGNEAKLALLAEENDELRNLLSVSTTPGIAAGVVARPPFTPYDTLVIDKGSEDGILKGAPVYYGRGNALGFIRSVFPHTAFVTVFSSPDIETTVYLFGSDLFATAKGEGGGVVHISVPQGVALEKGSPVVLPSIESGMLGVVDEIQSIPTEPEQHAYVTLSVPLQSIRLVSVGTQPVTIADFETAVQNVDSEEAKLFRIHIPEGSEVYSTGTTSTTTVVLPENATST